MNDERNLRQNERRRTLFGGTIFDEDGNVWECSISDVSEAGARVKAAGADLPMGTFVDLKINKFNDFRRCKVMWLREGYIGLQFLIKLDRNKEEIGGFFKLLKKH